MKTIVVLSSPRSGSSLIAGVLDCLGVFIGSKGDLVKRGYLNKFGCYENQDFLRYNLNVLAMSDAIPGYKPPSSDSLKRVVGKTCVWVVDLIKKNECSLWGWKDPSTIYSLPYFHEQLINPYYVYIKRDLRAVLKSHFRTSKKRVLIKTIKSYNQLFTKKNLLRLVIKYLRAMIKWGDFTQREDLIKANLRDQVRRIKCFIKNKHSITISFERLINEPGFEIDRLINFLGIEPTRKQERDALRFVRPEEVHC